ncbi:MAG: hypothetical protein ACI4WH_05565 [Oscillospiraceae bacterium]
MIFTIFGTDGVAVDIHRDTVARFTKFDKKYKRLQKQYTSSTGETITYGQRLNVEVINFTIECNQDSYDLFMPIFQNSYEYTIKYSFDDTKIFEEITGKKYFLSSEITESKIYNADGGLYTISGTFEEV